MHNGGGKSSLDISDQRLFNEPKAEHTNRLISKLEEMRRLAATYLQSDILDPKIRSLTQDVMNGSASETFVDECLE
jgi:hypothetical protein